MRPMLQPGVMQIGIGHCLVLGTLAWLGGKADGVDQFVGLVFPGRLEILD